MNTIQIYCKANKRNREGRAISVCGHIVKAGEHYEEDAYVVEAEGNGILLELMALMNALLDQEEAERLNEESLLEIYVCNEYIYKVLKDKEERQSKGIDKAKYTSYWEEINELINACGNFKSYCTDKKYRVEGNEEMVKNMAHLNRMVCEKVNGANHS